MSESCLELSVLLWVAHVLCQAVTVLPELGITRGAAYMFSPRDTEMVPKGLVADGLSFSVARGQTFVADDAPSS